MHFLMSSAAPLGKIADWFYRVEYQQRGSPHIHMLIWLESAPVYGCDDDDDVTSFTDEIIIIIIKRVELCINHLSFGFWLFFSLLQIRPKFPKRLVSVRETLPRILFP